MADAVDRGFTVTELASLAQPIEVTRETTAAFVGRALRGPLNDPVLVSSVAEFRRRFGEARAPSTLGPAIAQFFEHGGARACVVRVANKARGAMLCLPASGSALVLRAVEPGMTERIRAAVDYDGIDDADVVSFNLTLQRIDPATGLVRDQEIYRGASIDPESDASIVGDLNGSAIARAEPPFPTHRPEPTSGRYASAAPPYVGHAQDGSDGADLTDYDLVGSRRAGTGLFALEGVPRFDLLYLPPGPDRGPGPASLLAAERYCQERGAMLIVDPPAGWNGPEAAVRGIEALDYASPNMLGYFPALIGRDDGKPLRAPGGAVAGLVCKLDRRFGAWQSLDDAEVLFSRRVAPAERLNPGHVATLARAGLNAVVPTGRGGARLAGNVTLARGGAAPRDFASLSIRRLVLAVTAAIADGTRWAVFDGDRETVTERTRAQVAACLEALVDLGALERVRRVVCDLDAAGSGAGRTRSIEIHIAFDPVGSSRPLALTLHQSAAGCRVAATAFGPGATD